MNRLLSKRQRERRVRGAPCFILSEAVKAYRVVAPDRSAVTAAPEPAALRARVSRLMDLESAQVQVRL